MSDAAAPTEKIAEAVPSPGALPAWTRGELPAPVPFGWRNIFRAIGPGIIVLGGSIGTGEWLLGPAVTAKYGGGLLWLATVAILLQLALNLSCVRYTLYSGEPVFTGFMRCRPGPRFWAILYLLVDSGSLWPAFAMSVATLLAAAFMGVGHIPDVSIAADRRLVLTLGYVMTFVVVLLVTFGGKVYNALNAVMSVMVIYILGYLTWVGFMLVSADTWHKVLTGFFSFGRVPSGLALQDWSVIAGFAAYAGAGGLSNATISNYVRDKGWGMGAQVGAIPSIVGGSQITLSHLGKVFTPTAENLRRWKLWWHYVLFDQGVIWAIGCFGGVLLPALLTVNFVPTGTDFFGKQAEVASIQARGIAGALPQYGNLLWTLTLICGFFILFSTQVQVVDHVARRWTDILWTGGSAGAAKLEEHQVKYIYYGVMLAYTVLGCILMPLAKPFTMVVISACTGGFAMVVTALHSLYVNRRFLPRSLQGEGWRRPLREVALVACALFYGVMTILAVYGVLHRP